MSRRCAKCGEEFYNKKLLFDHLRNDNCEKLVKQHNALYKDEVVPKPIDEEPILIEEADDPREQHEIDLDDFADWGED